MNTKKMGKKSAISVAGKEREIAMKVRVEQTVVSTINRRIPQHVHCRNVSGHGLDFDHSPVSDAEKPHENKHAHKKKTTKRKKRKKKKKWKRVVFIETLLCFHISSLVVSLFSWLFLNSCAFSHTFLFTSSKAATTKAYLIFERVEQLSLIGWGEQEVSLLMKDCLKNSLILCLVLMTKIRGLETLMFNFNLYNYQNVLEGNKFKLRAVVTFLK